MASSGSPDLDLTEIDVIDPIAPEPAASPDLAEPPLDIDAGIPDPLKRDIVPGQLPVGMPMPD